MPGPGGEQPTVREAREAVTALTGGARDLLQLHDPGSQATLAETLAADVVAPLHLRAALPFQLDEYSLLRVLGSGGFGVVYLGLDRDRDPVAVKTLSDTSTRMRARFRREGELLRELGGRGFPHFYRGDFDDDSPWFAMEYIQGVTVQAAVGAIGPSPALPVLKVAKDIASALAVMHSLGYTHRDVKPANVILHDGTATLIDVGIAKGDPAVAVTTTTKLGTPTYAAPERLLGREATDRSDVYSLGLMMLFMNSGHGPFDTSDFSRVFALATSGSIDMAGVDADLAPLIRAMTATDPAKRVGLVEAQRAIEKAIERSEEPRSIANGPGLGGSRLGDDKPRAGGYASLSWADLLDDEPLMAELERAHSQGYDGAAAGLISAALGRHRLLTDATVGEAQQRIWLRRGWRQGEHSGLRRGEDTYAGWQDRARVLKLAGLFIAMPAFVELARLHRAGTDTEARADEIITRGLGLDLTPVSQLDVSIPDVRAEVYWRAGWSAVVPTTADGERPKPASPKSYFEDDVFSVFFEGPRAARNEAAQPENTLHNPRVRPKRGLRWWSTLTMFTLWIVGMAVLVAGYLSAGQFPLPGIGPWNMTLGAGLLAAGYFVRIVRPDR